ALNLSLEALRTRRPNVPTNVVVITDGFSYDIVDGPAEELHRLPNVRTFTVTVTDAWRESELQTIAGNPRRVFKGMESVPQLVTALTSCNSGPRKGEGIPDEPSIDSFLSSRSPIATTTTTTITTKSATYVPILSSTQKETLRTKP
uniref:VWFA domain-containing protein n=1 Tax=Parascaris univalens TaxID=6257 RepID=A0A915BB91_PARUN